MTVIDDSVPNGCRIRTMQTLSPFLDRSVIKDFLITGSRGVAEYE